MDLYFSPLACSMSSRIALYESGGAARFIQVDPKTKRTPDGADFLAVNALGLVPALRTDAGELLTENAAVLQYIADQYPGAALVPAGGIARSRLHQWLSFIGTELHKALFVPLLDPRASGEVRERALEKGESRLAYVDGYLGSREFLLEQFSVADAYLFTVLNWNLATPVALGKWPAVEAYYERLKSRPSIARALSEELSLYAEEGRRRDS